LFKRVFGFAIYGRNNWVVSLGLLLTLLFSAVQYHLVEDPFRKGHLYPRGTVTKLVVSFLVVASVKEDRWSRHLGSDIRYEVTVLKKNVIGEDRIVLNRENEILNRMDTNGVLEVFDGRSVLNLYSQLCNADLCSQVKNGKFMYEDGSHLSSLGSLAIAPALEQALRLLIQN
jgi:hypothetical protein